VAVGGVEAIKRFEQALREGPPNARIEGVGITDCAPTGLGSGFSILP
jgi:acylphosphatase